MAARSCLTPPSPGSLGLQQLLGAAGGFSSGTWHGTGSCWKCQRCPGTTLTLPLSAQSRRKALYFECLLCCIQLAGDSWSRISPKRGLEGEHGPGTLRGAGKKKKVTSFSFVSGKGCLKVRTNLYIFLLKEREERKELKDLETCWRESIRAALSCYCRLWLE